MPLFAIAIAVLVATALLSITEPAQANGRFPEAQAIESVPGDPNTLFLRTTFGILVSRDAGAHWHWICERALGYEGQWDPPIAVTRDGRLWVGLEDGLRVTRDGCTVDVVPELDGHTVKDLTTDARGETVYAITGVPGKRGFVWRRSPTTVHFERLAGLDDINLMTIEVAPSLSSRIYISGQPYTTIRGQIYRSDDGGSSFKTEVGPRPSDAGSDAALGGRFPPNPLTRPVSADGGTGSAHVGPGVLASELVADGPLFIGAIDPQDPNRILVRHLHAKGSDLLVTRDGGRTFKNVLNIPSAMYGFAKSDDGKTYWAGSGLADHGIFRSTDRGEHFEPYSKNGVLCLHASRGVPGGEKGKDALFVCQNALSAGAPAVGVSRDQGKTIASLARFDDIEGPILCAMPDASSSLCAGAWPELKALFSADAGTGEPDAGRRRRKRVPEAGTAGDAADPPPRASCACDGAGATTTTNNGITDLLHIIVWLLPLWLRGRASVLRGSKLTRRRTTCSI